MQPCVSIVVPVYNVEKYLEECVESIVKQTLKNIEIIIVNDGSTDNSEAIINRFVEKDNRIKAIHNTNHGYGHAVNTGIKNATGEYIGIVESDDFIRENMYEVLYDEARINNLDIVKSNRNEVYTLPNDEIVVEKRNNENYNGLYDTIFCPREQVRFFLGAPDTWAGIYRRDFLLENELFHNETPGASYQDIGFAFKTGIMAESAKVLYEAFYCYRIDNVTSSVRSKDKVYATHKEYESIYSFLCSKGNVYSKELWKAFFSKKYGSYINTMNRISEHLIYEYLLFVQKEGERESKDSMWDTGFLDETGQSQLKRIIESPETFICTFFAHPGQIFKRMVEKYENIIIYGAGKIGQNFADIYLVALQQNLSRVCYVVTENITVECINKFKVFELSEVTNKKNDSFVIIAVGEKLQDEFKTNLEKYGYKNYVSVRDLIDKIDAEKQNIRKIYGLN